MCCILGFDCLHNFWNSLHSLINMFHIHSLSRVCLGNRRIMLLGYNYNSCYKYNCCLNNISLQT